MNVQNDKGTVSFNSLSVSWHNVSSSVTNNYIRVVPSPLLVNRVPKRYHSLVSGGRVTVRTDNVRSSVCGRARNSRVMTESVHRPPHDPPRHISSVADGLLPPRVTVLIIPPTATPTVDGGTTVPDDRVGLSVRAPDPVFVAPGLRHTCVTRGKDVK